MDLDRPEIGQDIYVPTSLYMSHGRNDFQGGLCEVIAVEETNWGSKPTIVVEVKEREGHNYNWTGCLAPNQEKYKEKYGDDRGYPDPDLRPRFNLDDFLF